MGAATIVQNSISQTSQSFWQKVGPKVPQVSIDTSKYNRGFVDFCMVVGLYATVKLSYMGVKELRKKLSPNKALDKQPFLQRYGEGSWAIIADVNQNQQYCMYLAKQGLNLILMGELTDIQIVRDMLQVEGHEVRTITYPADWSKRDFSYEQFVRDIKDYDISFLVLPKMEQSKTQSSFGTHVEQIPVYQHYYMLIRHLGPVLQWRSFQSAIILPSSKQVGKIIKGHGVRQGVITALDAQMRTLNFELRNAIDVITVRGTVDQCFRDLGKKPISE